MTDNQKQATRKVLLIGGPLLVILVAAGFYIFSGRYISTDNSYVKANKVMVSPEISGVILPVTVGDNQPVHKGDVLFSIDPAQFKIEVDRATANLNTVVTQINDLKAQALQKQEELKIAQSDADFALLQYNRQVAPSMKEAVSQQSREDAQHERDVTLTKVAQLKQELNSILAQLNGDANIAPEDHPLYKAAKSALDMASLNLSRTVVRAPVDGTTGEMPKTGDYAHAGVPSLSVVEDGDVWIEANFKETELTRMREGQPVEIDVDTYPGHKWQGKVVSISPATGAEFSVLPAQNATGNWVKVVQRIAVRIAPDRQQGDPPLRTGMSANVTVDTGSYPHLSHDRVANSQ